MIPVFSSSRFPAFETIPMVAVLSVDPYILTFSALTVIATIWMGFWSARKSKTASDFFVAGRSVSVGWNASAISGEYLSAASFMGVAGMVMSSGYDALWYPVCYACGYLFLLLFIAGPLRRFGAYTIPDFAEGRFDSPVFRKIAVIFVLFIGFFYTMPQMKGAGTTLAYIFPGLPYWAGVVLVGAVITLNVALGGMKGITLVQAFQYWLKMFAISVPIFVLMAVYGHYGKQVGVNGSLNASKDVEPARLTNELPFARHQIRDPAMAAVATQFQNFKSNAQISDRLKFEWRQRFDSEPGESGGPDLNVVWLCDLLEANGFSVFVSLTVDARAPLQTNRFLYPSRRGMPAAARQLIKPLNLELVESAAGHVFVLSAKEQGVLVRDQFSTRPPLPAKAPSDET